jgi:hypothetical protein
MVGTFCPWFILSAANMGHRLGTIGLRFGGAARFNRSKLKFSHARNIDTFLVDVVCNESSEFVIISVPVLFWIM